VDKLTAPKPQARRSGYAVKALRINRPLAAATFAMPPLPDGALVTDESGGRSFIKGGYEARDRLLAAHPEPKAAPTDPAPQPSPARATDQVAAAREPGRFPWGAVLVASSLGCMALAWKLGRP
jgi:hypothetical protein